MTTGGAAQPEPLRSEEPFELHFTGHPMTSDDSLALLLSNNRSRCGIYWIDFADGASYVGQSVSTRSRLAAHRRRWNDAVLVRFAECPPERLDEFELATIQLAQKSRPLRNKLLTSRPGGERDLEVTVRHGESLTLPWDRERRGPVGTTLAIVEPTAGQRAAFEKMEKVPGFDSVAHVLAAIIREAIPSPAASQGVLWSVSALPSTNRARGWRRLATLSAGRVEVLRVFEAKNGEQVDRPSFLNLAPDTDERGLARAFRRIGITQDRVSNGEYAALNGIRTVEVPALDQLSQLLDEPVVIESVYRLVVTLMRQGSAPLRRVHNPVFAEYLLALARH